MKAILVSVDYADLLALTLPWNRHHFTDVVVVTTPTDVESRLVALRNECRVHMTDSFYDDGAVFNKWKALEEGFDILGRDGVICNMDADILWPKVIPAWTPLLGKIYTPKRRMLHQIGDRLPEESSWSSLPYHNYQLEWSGYTQVFHGEDPVLGPSPWHQTNWRHAGGGDSFFQQKWKPADKLRPPFEVLHLGESAVNWCGRTTARLDGSVPEQASERRQMLRSMISQRRKKQGRPDAYSHEQI